MLGRMGPSDRFSHTLSRPLSGTGLRGLLRTIDGGPFLAYRKILGEHELGDFSLAVISVPPDALAGPARLRLSIDRARAGLEAAWSRGDIARLVLEDAIVRAAARVLDELAGPSRASAPGSGRVWIEPPSPVLVERTSARVDDRTLELSLAFDLPASARRVRGQQAEAILFEHLPRVGMAALLFPLRRLNDLRSQIEAASRRSLAAGALDGRGLAALVPASALSRRSLPATGTTTVATPEGPVSGLAIPTGITLFIATGMAGAGSWLREMVAAQGNLDERGAILAGPAAMLPACLDEAVEAGAQILVLDDDTPSSTATPALRLAELRDRWGLSFFIAARGVDRLGDVADSVFLVGDDRIEDGTEAHRGRQRAAGKPPHRTTRAVSGRPAPRSMRIVTGYAPERLKVGSWGRRGVRVGDDLIDLSDTTLVTDAARLRAVAALLKRAAAEAKGWRPVDEVLDALHVASARPLLDRLEEPGLVDLARPARIEIAAALARWKRVTFRVAAGTLSPAVEDPK
jgi:predicted ABC-class ATPase